MLQNANIKYIFIVIFCLLRVGKWKWWYNGKSVKIITIGTGEITGGRYISFPKSSLKGNYYKIINI